MSFEDKLKTAVEREEQSRITESLVEILTKRSRKLALIRKMDEEKQFKEKVWRAYRAAALQFELEREHIYWSIVQKRKLEKEKQERLEQLLLLIIALILMMSEAKAGPKGLRPGPRKP